MTDGWVMNSFRRDDVPLALPLDGRGLAEQRGTASLSRCRELALTTDFPRRCEERPRTGGRSGGDSGRMAG